MEIEKSLLFLELAEYASRNGDLQEAASYINQARNASPNSTAIAIACANAVMVASWAKQSLAKPEKSAHSEYATVQAWFKREHESLIIGSSLVKVKLQRYRPDFVVVANGETLPVECKKVFNKRALNQLLAYMDDMNAHHGYAVAHKLTTALPENITLIVCPVTES